MEQKRPYDFNPYGAGRKVYGGGRDAPNVGPVADKSGYVERDLKKRTTQKQNNAILRRMQAQLTGNYLSPANLGSQQTQKGLP